MARMRDIGDNENYVLKLPLQVTKEQADFLNKRYQQCRCIYNDLQRKMLRKLAYIRKMKAYNSLDNNTARKKFLTDYEIDWKNGRGQIVKLKPFTQFGFKSYIAVFAKTYNQYGINSVILRGIANNAWDAWKAYMKNTYEHRIHFRKWDEINSFVIGSTGNFCGLDLTSYNDGIIGINYNGGTKGRDVKYHYVHFKVKTEYEKEALANGEPREFTFQREYIRGKWKYYILITLEGKKPQKNRKLGTGRVGIDLGVSTIALASDDVVFMDVLAKGIKNIHAKCRRLQRKMDRSKRATNPLRYTENGEIREYDEGEDKPKWKFSKHYRKLRNKTKELSRKRAALRRLSHTKLANNILVLGNEFIVEKNPVQAWARKSKETTLNKKGKINSKKRFGKSVGEHAPSAFKTILKNKVVSLGGSFIEVDVKNAASRFDFTNQTFTEHPLKERRIKLSNGNTHCRDSLAAFNLQHLKVGDDTLKEYDVEMMNAKYDKFCRLEEEEINRHLSSDEHISSNFGIRKK